MITITDLMKGRRISRIIYVYFVCILVDCPNIIACNRNVTERPEGVEAGISQLVPLIRNKIVEAVSNKLGTMSENERGVRMQAGAESNYPRVCPTRNIYGVLLVFSSSCLFLE